MFFSSSTVRAARPLFHKTAIALVIASSLAPQRSHAGPDIAATGPELAVNSYTIGGQLNSFIAMDADGDFAVTWTDFYQDGSGSGIYARAFNADGRAKPSGEVQVNTYTTGNQSPNAIAMDADGDFVVIWISAQDGSLSGVYARAFNADGTPKPTGEIQVNTYTLGNQSAPRIAMDAGGDFVVTWNSQDQDGSGDGVYARAFDADGTPKPSGEVRVNVYTLGNQTRHEIAMDADGDFVVTWHSNGQDGSGYGVYARAFNADGTPKSGELPVNTYTTGAQNLPDVAMNASGDFAVTWAGSGPLDITGTFVRAYHADGTPKTGELQVNTYTTGVQGPSLIAMDADGDFAVTWRSLAQDGSGFGVYARAFNGDGTPKTGELPVNTYTTGAQLLSGIDMDADGDFVVTWTSTGQDGSDDSVHARAFNPDGTPKPRGEVQVNTYTLLNQTNPDTAMNADGDVVVTWTSNGQDGSSFGIYAQRFTPPADLVLSVTSSPASGVSNVGGSVTYSYVLRNNDAEILATDTGLDIRLPSGFVYDTFMGTNWTCNPVPTLACHYTPTLAAGETAEDLFVTLTMPATPIRAYVIGKAFSAETDSAPGNNGASALTVVCDPNTVDNIKVTSASVTEAVGSAVIRVTRTGGACSAASVNYATSDGTATGGSDYTAANGTLNWAIAEQGAKTFSVPVTNDTALETGEIVNLTLSNGSLGTTVGPAGKLIIIDDDVTTPTVSLSVDEQAIRETDGVATVTATLSAVTGLPVTVPLTLTGTATNKRDYTLSATKIVIPANSLSASVMVSTLPDTISEGNETVTLTMATPVNANAAGTTSNTVTITDDDNVPTVGFAASSNYREGSAGNGGVARVTLSNPSSQPVTVTVSVTGGTATLDSDFTLNNGGSLTIPAGQTSVPAAFVINDADVESTETASFTLSNVTGATVGNATHTLKIFDALVVQ